MNGRSKTKREFKPLLPVKIMGNMRSLANKMEKPEANMKIQQKYHESSIMCVSDTWLQEHIPDFDASVHGF